MHSLILNHFEGFDLDSNSKLFKNIEHVMYRAINGNPDKLQEIYDVFYGKEKFKMAFLEYGEADFTVTIQDKTDLEQVYIKGIVDGMRVYQTFMNFFAKTHPYLDKEEEQ